LGVKGNELNFGQTIYSSFIIWFTDSSSRIVKADQGVVYICQSNQSINQAYLSKLIMVWCIFVKAINQSINQSINQAYLSKLIRVWCRRSSTGSPPSSTFQGNCSSVASFQKQGGLQDRLPGCSSRRRKCHRSCFP